MPNALFNKHFSSNYFLDGEGNVTTQLPCGELGGKH